MPISFIALFVTLPIVALTLTAVYFIRQSSRPASSETTDGDTEPVNRWRQARRAGYWGSAVSLAIVYMLTGVPKVSGFSEVLHRFEAWNYSENFMLFIGASEFIAGIFLLLPSAARFAAAYLIIIMTGAVYTHLAFDSAVWALLPLFCLSFLSYIVYEDWMRGTDRSAWIDRERADMQPA